MVRLHDPNVAARYAALKGGQTGRSASEPPAEWRAIGIWRCRQSPFVVAELPIRLTDYGTASCARCSRRIPVCDRLPCSRRCSCVIPIARPRRACARALPAKWLSEIAATVAAHCYLLFERGPFRCRVHSAWRCQVAKGHVKQTERQRTDAAIGECGNDLFGHAAYRVTLEPISEGQRDNKCHQAKQRPAANGQCGDEPMSGDQHKHPKKNVFRHVGAN